MNAFHLKDVKTFMAKLLSSDIFDSFLLEEAKIETSHTILIDGHFHRDFYTSEELEEMSAYEYTPWALIRPQVFQLIKGKKVPKLLKLTLLSSPDLTKKLLTENDLLHLEPYFKAFVLNIRFDHQGLLLTTGTSFSSFTLDKDGDLFWDKYCLKYLSQQGIDGTVIVDR